MRKKNGQTTRRYFDRCTFRSLEITSMVGICSTIYNQWSEEDTMLSISKYLITTSSKMGSIEIETWVSKPHSFDSCGSNNFFNLTLTWNTPNCHNFYYKPILAITYILSLRCNIKSSECTKSTLKPCLHNCTGPSPNIRIQISLKTTANTDVQIQEQL